MKNISLAFVSTLAIAACGKHSGGAIGAPQVYPPTAAVTPSSLVTSSGAALTINSRQGLLTQDFHPQSDSVLDLIKTRLFSSGPTNLLQLVKNVDNRMTQLDSQFSTKPTCFSGTAVDYSTTFGVPAATGATTTKDLPLFLQCGTSYSGETSDVTGHLLVGQKDNTWYLVDGDTGSGAMSVGQVTGTSDADRVVDGYMIVLPHNKAARENNYDGSTALIHYKADAAAGTLEFTAGGVGIGFAQAHAKSNATHFYIELLRDNSGATLETGCFTKTDLTSVADATVCTSQTDLAFSLVTLGTTANGQTSMGTAVSATTANNVNLTELNAHFITKLSTAFADVPEMK